jgi:hypothetical protein
MTLPIQLMSSPLVKKTVFMSVIATALIGSTAIAQATTAPPAAAPAAEATQATSSAPAPVITSPAASAPSEQPTAVAVPVDVTTAPPTAAPAAETTTQNPAPAVVPTPTMAVLNAIPAPPEGKAQVVFYRPAKLTGMALRFSVRDGDTGIGKLQNGSYFVHTAEPGAREYNIASEVRDTLRLEIEPGETYYVVQSISMGLMVGRPNLTPSDSMAFQAKKLKVTTLTATDR